MTDHYPSMYDEFEGSYVPKDERCGRCKGEGYVDTVLFVDDYGDPQYGSIDCPRCGGSGRAPDPIEKAEQVAAYGTEALEYY